VLEHALLATGFPTTTRDTPRNFQAFEAVYRRSRGVRRMGAAALDLASVAAGWFDGYWEGPLCPWDVAAGALLVREAGGTMSDLDGGPFSPDHGRALATNGAIHDELCALLRSIAP
jgi:myo-inositol-1(or 4)-monophosphatase